MPGFLVGHASHPDWPAALALAQAALQIDGQRASPAAGSAGPPRLGFVYFTDHWRALHNGQFKRPGPRAPSGRGAGCV